MFSVVVGAIIEQLGVDLHEELHGIVDHTVNRPWLG